MKEVDIFMYSFCNSKIVLNSYGTKTLKMIPDELQAIEPGQFHRVHKGPSLGLVEVHGHGDDSVVYLEINQRHANLRMLRLRSENIAFKTGDGGEASAQ